MINLLPSKEKEQLLSESNRKLTIVLGSIFLVSLVSLILVLFSLKFYILEQLVLQKGNLSSIEKGYQDKDYIEAKENMQKYNGNIVKIYNFYKNQVYISDNLVLISKIERPKGLYFKTINIESSNNKDVNVKITGFSNTRENLQSFKDNLDNFQDSQLSMKIEDIYFPSYVWLKANDIEFNLTFKIIKNENQSK